MATKKKNKKTAKKVKKIKLKVRNLKDLSGVPYWISEPNLELRLQKIENALADVCEAYVTDPGIAAREQAKKPIMCDSCGDKDTPAVYQETTAGYDFYTCEECKTVVEKLDTAPKIDPYDYPPIGGAGEEKGWKDKLKEDLRCYKCGCDTDHGSCRNPDCALGHWNLRHDRMPGEGMAG